MVKKSLQFHQHIIEIQKTRQDVFVIYFGDDIQSLAFLFVMFLIHWLPLTTCLFDFFHVMSWKTWPIRFRHLIDGHCGFACSTTLFWLSLHSNFPFSHAPIPLLSSNLIDINESANNKQHTCKRQFKRLYDYTQ